MATLPPVSDSPSQISGAASDGEDSPVEDASNAVAMDLVRALSQANKDAPIYTNGPRHRRGRVIESDIEEIQVSPPHIDECNPPREETRTSSTFGPAPVASGSSSSRPVRSDSYSIAKPPLPRTSTLKRPRTEETLDTREHGLQPRHSSDMSGPAQDSSLTASGRLPKKRKGPPGIPRDVMDRQLSEQKQKFEQKRKSEQRRKRREQSSRRGPEQSYSIGNHNTVRRSSARDIDAPARRVSRLDPPPTLPSGKAIVRTSASAGNQGFDEQDSVMVTSGPIDEVSRQGLSQAVVAISGASDPTHVPTVSIRASLSASTSTTTSLFGQPPPAPPMHTVSYREADHPPLSRPTTIQGLLNIQNNNDVSLGTLVDSIRHLASAGLKTEQQRQDFENSLQALTVEVRTLAEAKRNLEEELGSVQGQLGSMKDELSNVSSRLQKEREERGPGSARGFESWSRR
ncbi:hypothetical protein NUW54_g13881 [Trametes sanguinea]|uniref:Uncharacterized protein n=1 Tax=Trametes sanguinea TaxID=158606 RepID=A0ACC1MIU7_9APHY|nr:hypothetical protein NUW54_g13881 [Trametes sanguinea]